jgi:hypothetical protein
MDIELLKTSFDLENSFTGNCECIENIEFEDPVLYNDYNPKEYCEQTSKKIDLYLEEAYKHLRNIYSNSITSKPCYKKQHTTALVLLRAYNSYRRTLLSMRQAVLSLKEGEEGGPNIVFRSGKKIPAYQYIETYETSCVVSIRMLRAYKNVYTKIPATTLLNTLQQHKSILNVFKYLVEEKNVERPSEDVVNKLEVASSTPV